MTRAEVRALIKDTADSFAPAVRFSSGLLTFFNSKRENVYPYIFQQIAPVAPTFPNPNISPVNEWEIVLYFADLDKVDSVPDQYEPIIDRMDDYAAKFITKVNQIVSGYKNVTIEGSSREPFVKKHADCVTGVTLTFTLVETDKTNYC